MTIFRTAALNAPAPGQAARRRIDPVRWPDVAVVPAGPRATVSARIAQRIFTYAVSRLRIRVILPDGRMLGGDRRPGARTIVVHDLDAMMRRIGAAGLIGFGESYLAGEWDSDDLAAVVAEFADGVERLVPAPLRTLRASVLQRQPASDRPAVANSRSNVERHYDLSNEMFATFLDETMTYSSALFEGAQTDLAVAQRRKTDRLLDQLQVAGGTELLEIGSGWGSLALRAADRGAHVESITLSGQQQAFATTLLREHGVQDRARVDLRDYREVSGTYDAVASVEMIEAVGLDFLDVYFATIAGCLKPGGRAAVQAIVMPHHRAVLTRDGYTWIHKYIFPGGALPSTQMIRASAARAGLQIVDDLPMGDSYALTLRMWADRFARNTARLDELGFDETFRRMWDFYLRYSEGGFRTGYLDVRQLTFARTVDAA